MTELLGIHAAYHHDPAGGGEEGEWYFNALSMNGHVVVDASSNGQSHDEAFEGGEKVCDGKRVPVILGVVCPQEEVTGRRRQR